MLEFLLIPEGIMIGSYVNDVIHLAVLTDLFVGRSIKLTRLIC